MPCACAIPLIIGSLPILANAAVKVATTLGFSLVSTTGTSLLQNKLNKDNQVEQETVVIPFENSELFNQEMEKKELCFDKEGMAIRLSANERGKYSLQITGTGKTKAELLNIGQDMKERITQQYIYHKVMTGLKEKGYVMVGEELEADRAVHVVVRRFA